MSRFFDVAKWVDVAGHRIRYFDTDPEGVRGAGLVCVHGVPGSARDFSKLVEPLAENHRVVIPDLLGFGASDKPLRFPYDLRGRTNHLVAFLDALGLERPVLIGHSLGGALAQCAAGSTPDRFPALILLASSGPIPHRAYRRYAPLLKAVDVGLRIPGFFAVLRPFATLALRRIGFSPRAAKERQNFIPFVHAVTRMAFKELADAAVHIRCPVLSVSCEADWAVEPAVMDALREIVPQLQIHRLPGSTHDLPNQQTDPTQRLIQDFLAKIRH